jgi:hypothetical protein
MKDEMNGACNMHAEVCVQHLDLNTSYWVGAYVRAVCLRRLSPQQELHVGYV